MAVKEANSKYKSFTFNGVSAADYGVYVTDVNVFNSAERAVEYITIPGRNGSFALDHGRFENITVVYDCALGQGTDVDFATAISDFRNALASAKGYQRLEDDMNPDEYRMAVFAKGLEAPTLNQQTATFKVEFNCKPQRYLKSGEIPRTIGGQVTNTQTKSGAVVALDSDGGDKVTSLIAQIEPVQAGSGDPSPTNVRPITGWTDANVKVNGKNFTPSNWVAGTLGNNAAGVINISSSTAYRNRDIQLPAGTYTFSSESNHNSFALYIYSWDGTKYVINESKSVLSLTTGVKTRTIDEGELVGVVIRRSEIAGGDDIANIKFQIELGTTATAYKPYTGHTTTAALGQTVYGGTLDVVTGVLTVTHKMVDLGTYSWSYRTNSTKPFFTTDISGLPLKSVMRCSIYKQSTLLPNNASMPDYSMSNQAYFATPHNLLIVDSRYTDAASFKTAMNGVQLVYELTTPQTYQLTAQEVELLTGNNHVWADTGDITLTYGDDPNKIVNPTLFDASPLLKVYGYGDIVLGYGGTVSVSEDVTVGNTVIANGGQVGLTYTESIVMGSDKFMTGDVITLASTSININLNTNESITSATASVSSGYSVNTSVTKINNRTLLATVLWDEETLTVGTSRDLSTIVNVSIVTSGGNVVVQIPATISYNASTRTITRTLQTPTAISGTVSRIGGYSILGSITGYSTAPSYTEPLYFDLDIGEAYAIEDGVPVSINNAVSFGTVLPVLKPGANTITRSVTITDLKIIPRWWKV